MESPVSPSRPPPVRDLLEAVLAGIGHEIKNPLAAALASVEFLRDPESAGRLGAEERRGAVEDTALALRRIQDVMNAVTSLVRGAPPVLEQVSVWECAERALSALGSRTMRLELAGDRQVCGWANAPLLEQVIANLAQNALDATRDAAHPQILVRVYRAGLEARISVRDNGPSERRAGLGLVLMRHAVWRMGGTVTLGPTHTGAVFRVRLRAG